MLHKLRDLAEILETFANATASVESDDFGTTSQTYDWLFSIQEKSCPIAKKAAAIGRGLSEASVHWRQYIGENEGPERGHGMVLFEGVTLTDRVVVAAFLNPGSAYERSFSPGNQRQALAVVRQALALMQDHSELSAPVGAAREPSSAAG
jgi:hypothetical protein